jgi:hypothetical protein
LRTVCPGLALNCDPLDLCLLSSWDYRREPLVPGFIIITIIRDRYLLSNSGWPRTHDPPASVSQVLGLEASPHPACL